MPMSSCVCYKLQWENEKKLQIEVVGKIPFKCCISYHICFFFCVQLKNSLREKFFAEDDEGVGEGKKVAAAARKS